MCYRVLRVGGRLSHSSSAEGAKHTMILPADHHVSCLVVQNFHESNGHCGTLQTLPMVRESFGC